MSSKKKKDTLTIEVIERPSKVKKGANVKKIDKNGNVVPSIKQKSKKEKSRSLVPTEEEENILQQLNNFEEISKKDYKILPIGTPVRYMRADTGEFKTGGILIKNDAPERFMLKSYSRNITWSISLKENHVFYVQKIKTSDIKKVTKAYKNAFFEYFLDNIPEDVDHMALIDGLIEGEYYLSIERVEVDKPKPKQKKRATKK